MQLDAFTPRACGAGHSGLTVTRQAREVLDAMRADTADLADEGLHCLRVDGGAARNNTLMQLQVGAPVLGP